MKSPWTLLLALAIAAAIVAAAILAMSPPRTTVQVRPPPEAGDGGGRPTLSTGGARPRVPGAHPAAPLTPAALDAEIDALDRALTATDATAARAAARDLRLRLRTDPHALARAEARLLDPATGADLRMALALVLGTLPADAGDPALLRALERFSADAAFVRCALLALGAQREPADDDDVFGLGDRPHGATGPGGLGITVRRSIAPGDALRALEAHLTRAEPETRWAAARALGSSLRLDTVRAAFLATLASEASDDVASVVGEPLAAWAGSSADAAAREAIVSALLLRADEKDLDGFRFHLEDEFDRIEVAPRDRARLLDLAKPIQPYGVRAFALVALARSAARGGEPALYDARRALEATTSDEDAAARDLAAHWLGKLPPDRGTAVRLATLARKDPAWNVRWSALEALAATAPVEDVKPVLLAARSDADARVAARAAALLEGLAR